MSEIKTVYLVPVYGRASNFSPIVAMFKPFDDNGKKVLEIVQKAMGKYKELTKDGKDFNKKSFDENDIKFCTANIPSIKFVCSDNSPELPVYHKDQEIKFTTKIDIDLTNISNILD